MTPTAVAALFADLQEVELISWVERGWVLPETVEQSVSFHAIDVARVRLIYDLRRDMAVGEDALPLVLSLLDQVYDLRSTLKVVLQAVQAQPPEVQAQVLGALGRARPRD
jgi:chaperone modulatory protein CbpM